MEAEVEEMAAAGEEERKLFSLELKKKNKKNKESCFRSRKMSRKRFDVLRTALSVRLVSSAYI